MTATDAQVRKLMQERQKGRTQEQAAASANLRSCKTVRKYERLGELPSALQEPRTYRTRADLELTEVIIEEAVITLTVRSTQVTVMCPDCQEPSQRVHSHYGRTAADLPCAERQVRLELCVRRLFCDNPSCQRRTFAERFPPLLASSARRTGRLAAQQRRVGMDLGGEAGARLLIRMAMPVSGDTVLRLVRGTRSETTPQPRVLGIDDWAWRKGQRYGTILVDLEWHRPVELLPDRTAEMVAKWLQEHPGVEIVSRDRAPAYIEGIRRGAPNAIQVADRWHLLRNLKEALERLLEQNRACLSAVARPENRPAEPGPAPEGPAPAASADSSPLTKAEQRKQATRERRLACQFSGYTGPCPFTRGGPGVFAQTGPPVFGQAGPGVFGQTGPVIFTQGGPLVSGQTGPRGRLRNSQ